MRRLRTGGEPTGHGKATRFLAWSTLIWALALFQAKARTGQSLAHSAAVATILPGLIWGACHAFLRLPDRKTLLAASMAAMLSLVIGSLVFQTSGFARDPWKYALGLPLTVLLLSAVFVAVPRAGGAVLVVIGLLLGLLNTVLGFRSLGMVAVVGLVGTGVILAQASLFRRLVVSLLLAATAMGGLSAYGNLAEGGALGHEQQMKWAVQSQSEGGVLLGARPELIASVYAISRDPWFGRGNTPVSSGERLETMSAMKELDVPMDSAQQRRIFGSGVNSHSMALQSWVDGGVLAVVPWLGLLVIVWRGWARAITRRDAVAAGLGGLLSTQLTWDFLFSPWSPGYEVVIGLAFGIALSRIHPGGEAP